MMFRCLQEVEMGSQITATINNNSQALAMIFVKYAMRMMAMPVSFLVVTTLHVLNALQDANAVRCVDYHLMTSSKSISIELDSFIVIKREKHCNYF